MMIRTYMGKQLSDMSRGELIEALNVLQGVHEAQLAAKDRQIDFWRDVSARQRRNYGLFGIIQYLFGSKIP